MPKQKIIQLVIIYLQQTDLTHDKNGHAQLKSLFGIKLTPAELSALIEFFDQDGDRRVDGGEFLSVFFREGRKEKVI